MKFENQIAVVTGGAAVCWPAGAQMRAAGGARVARGDSARHRG